MKFGILFCAYNCADTVDAALSPWVDARKQSLHGHEFVISAVSVPFKEYEKIPVAVDDTPGYLLQSVEDNKIDFLFTQITPEFKYTESEARQKALEPLLAEKVDYVILWDGDEIPTIENIAAIINFVIADIFVVWYAISYKNYVFDTKTYLTAPFTPPRVFKVRSGNLTLQCFSWDNDLLYTDASYKDLSVYVDYRKLASCTIPPQVAWVKHLTWLSNEKTKAKVTYQQDHFKGVCSYRWNGSTNSLEFNPDYYASKGLPFPEIAQEMP